MAADYPGLVTIWATLNPGTTQQKLDQLNAITITGSIPATFNVTGLQILTCLDFTEFNSRTAAQQTAILQLCALPTMVGGANTFVGKLFANYYSNVLAGPTIAAFTALAKATVQPWWQVHGFSQPIGTADLTIAGGLS